MKRFSLLFCFLLCSFALQAQNVFEQVRLYVNSTDGVYQPGDTVKVTARYEGEGSESVLMQVVSYDQVLSKKKAVLSSGDNLIYTQIVSDPVSVIVKVSPSDNPKVSTSVGYLVAPQEFVPGFAIPSDLKPFWDSELVNMRKLKPEVKITPAVGVKDEDKEKFECYHIEINMPSGYPCRGYVAYPRGAAPGSLPIYLFVHSAGVNRPANKASASFVISRARQGYLVLDINAHGYLDDQPQEYYDALNDGELKNYASREFTGVSDYYFHNMYLRDLRALDYAVTLPVWDGKRILVHGESQGGGQALAIAGIDERVTHCVAIVPAITDIGAVLDGRKCGWPARSNAVYAVNPQLGSAVMAYHDGAILVSLFKGKLYVESGNIDVTCDPAAVCAGFNNAKAVQYKEIHYYPWRSHSWTNMEERVRDEWSKQVHTHRDAFFKAFLTGD